MKIQTMEFNENTGCELWVIKFKAMHNKSLTTSQYNDIDDLIHKYIYNLDK